MLTSELSQHCYTILMITAVIFDLDQTLVDRDATFKNFILKQHTRLSEQLSNTSAEAFYNLVKQYDNNGYTAKNEVYQKVCADFSLSPNIATNLFEDFKNNYGFEPFLFETVHDTLSELKQAYTLALITNGRTKGQNAKIDNAQLRDYFECIHISESEGVKKPNPIIFKRCLERLGINAENAVYIGDNPENDVKAAQACGMKAIWKRNQHYDEINYADKIIDNIADVQNIISKL